MHDDALAHVAALRVERLLDDERALVRPAREARARAVAVECVIEACASVLL
jgi:hypothetical protein